jgi:copper chaperone CopZ
VAIVKKFRVKGMDEQCSLILGKALEYLPGVKQTKVNSKDKSITIAYEPKITSQDQLIKVIMEEGYEVP